MAIESLLVANRGEIACRVLRTAKRMGIRTVAVYTPADAAAAHVRQADSAIQIHERGYMDAQQIVSVCQDQGVDAVHPGYGFLSENEDFAKACAAAGVTFLGPAPSTIKSFGLKHEARKLAIEAQVPVVPGTGLLDSVEAALEESKRLGFPVMLKSTAGGGGIGLQICRSEKDLQEKYSAIRTKSGNLFKNDQVFLEKYYPKSRHIEAQIMGNGKSAIHFGERECSVQRRHQKVIEETPSPFFIKHPDLREKLTSAAVRLAASIQYRSVGTVEFLVDDETGNFFFLEVNTRLQVEHPVTEAVFPGLDLVELMILQGAAERQGKTGVDDSLLESWSKIVSKGAKGHAIQARVYAENPSKEFRPSPGLLQQVEWKTGDGVRIDDWIESGITISPLYDPLLAKVIVHTDSRQRSTELLRDVLLKSKILGPPNNTAYLASILGTKTFHDGNCLTSFLDDFQYNAHAFEVLSPGANTTVQDYPGRVIGSGIPRGGAMDFLSHCIANALVGNPRTTETLEITFSGPELLFHSRAHVALAGAQIPIMINGKEKDLVWSSFSLEAGDRLKFGSAVKCEGLRTYLAIKGGMPSIPTYLGSKSTSAGMGGLQCRALVVGDFVDLASAKEDFKPRSLPSGMRPKFSHEWSIGVLRGPHDDDEFLTPEGREHLYSYQWEVSPASNRMGIRLSGPTVKYARANGGQGGSHPTNIHDWGYPFATLNLNGDTPVILTCDGPGCGGFICPLTIAGAEVWKTGQLKPGDKVRFVPIGQSDALLNKTRFENYLSALESGSASDVPTSDVTASSSPEGPVIEVLPETNQRPMVTYRQAGDEFILVEYGPLLLDFAFIARLKALQEKVKQIKGILYYSPCIRSMLVHIDVKQLSLKDCLQQLIAIESGLPPSEELRLPARELHLPLAWNDKWTRNAIARYAESIRNKALYVPSNLEYIARNNGMSVDETERALTSTSWICVAANFYSGAPFLIPIDPRCRLVAAKYNPTRTSTPEGAIGIGGMAACIYPYESPGGYQLFGRTLPMWKPFFGLDGNNGTRPWLMRSFDLIKFRSVSEDEFERTLQEFKSGLYQLDIRETVFDMKAHSEMESKYASEASAFHKKQDAAMVETEKEDRRITEEWEKDRKAAMAKEAQTVGGATADSFDAETEMITSPMTANVWKILVEQGTEITDDDTVVCILEAMKTEIPVKAENCKGKYVTAVIAAPGSSINAGDRIVAIGNK